MIPKTTLSADKGSHDATEPYEPEFSYADPGDKLLRRLLIRIVEQATGQPKLRRLYMQYRNEPDYGKDFWGAAIRKLQLRLEIEKGSLENLPASGPVVVVSNHPFGVIDGITICHLVKQRRSDFRILTNSVLYRAPEIREWLYPIDFSTTDTARRQNVASRNMARRWLADGGVLIVFPGGTVSTTPKPFARFAVDPDWQPFVAALIQRSQAPVIPFYFNGQNSRLFQIASHISQTLRLSLLFREVADRIGSTIRVRIGETIDPAEFAGFKERKEMATFLREATYRLGDIVPPTPSNKLNAIATRRSKQD